MFSCNFDPRDNLLSRSSDLSIKMLQRVALVRACRGNYRGIVTIYEFRRVSSESVFAAVIASIIFIVMGLVTCWKKAV
jgi:hypothetical protein